jgi:Zn-dependent protease
LTNQGGHSFIAKPENGSSRGFIGVDVGQVSSPVVNTPLKSTEYFLYTVFALSFMFNFLVAVVNLLPLPGFDGKRIYDASVKDKRITNFLAAVVVVTLLINIIPWI